MSSVDPLRPSPNSRSLRTATICSTFLVVSSFVSYRTSSTDSVLSDVADLVGHYLEGPWIDGNVKPKRCIPSAMDNKEVKSKRMLRVIRS